MHAVPKLARLPLLFLISLGVVSGSCVFALSGRSADVDSQQQLSICPESEEVKDQDPVADPGNLDLLFSPCSNLTLPTHTLPLTTTRQLVHPFGARLGISTRGPPLA